MRILRLTGLAAWRAIIDQWTWRSFMVTLMLGQVVGPLIGYLVWRSVVPDSGVVVWYFAAILAIQLWTVSYEDHTVAQAIHSGELAGDLLLPQPILLSFFGANLALRFWHSLFGLPVVILVVLLADGFPPLTQILLALPAIVIAGVLRFLFCTTLALSAFWTDQAASIVGLGNVLIGLMGGMAIPLFLLPAELSEVGRALPFWAMIGLPAEILAGTLTGATVGAGYLVQLAWLGLVALVATGVWHFGLRRYSAIGA